MTKIVTLTCACLLAVAVPLAGARTHATDGSVSGLDKQYLTTAMQGDLFEVAGGKLAIHRSRNKAVLRLAHRLITDYSKSLDDAKAVAIKLGIDVPTTPTESQQWELKIVSALHGKQFNQWYSSLEVADHLQDISETTDEVNDGGNSEIVSLAKGELPTLHEHLKLAKSADKAST